MWTYSFEKECMPTHTHTHKQIAQRDQVHWCSRYVNTNANIYRLQTIDCCSNRPPLTLALALAFCAIQWCRISLFIFRAAFNLELKAHASNWCAHFPNKMKTKIKETATKRPDSQDVVGFLFLFLFFYLKDSITSHSMNINAFAEDGAEKLQRIVLKIAFVEYVPSIFSLSHFSQLPMGKIKKYCHYEHRATNKNERHTAKHTHTLPDGFSDSRKHWRNRTTMVLLPKVDSLNGSHFAIL